MTENKVGSYEGIRSGLQQTHIIVIASVASKVGAIKQRNLLRTTLLRHCERSAAIYCGPHYLQLTKPRSPRRTSAPRDDGE